MFPPRFPGIQAGYPSDPVFSTENPALPVLRGYARLNLAPPGVDVNEPLLGELRRQLGEENVVVRA